EVPEDVEAAAIAQVVGEPDVEQQHVRTGAFDDGERLLRAPRLEDLDALDGAHDLAEQSPRASLIVDEKDLHRADPSPSGELSSGEPTPRIMWSYRAPSGYA